MIRSSGWAMLTMLTVLMDLPASTLDVKVQGAPAATGGFMPGGRLAEARYSAMDVELRSRLAALPHARP